MELEAIYYENHIITLIEHYDLMTKNDYLAYLDAETAWEEYAESAWLRHAEKGNPLDPDWWE